MEVSYIKGRLEKVEENDLFTEWNGKGESGYLFLEEPTDTSGLDPRHITCSKENPYKVLFVDGNEEGDGDPICYIELYEPFTFYGDSYGGFYYIKFDSGEFYGSGVPTLMEPLEYTEDYGEAALSDYAKGHINAMSEVVDYVII